MDLKKMMGPLPLWGWLAIIIGGLGIAWWSMGTRESSGYDEEIEVTDTSIDPGVGNLGPPGYVNRGGPPPEGEDDDEYVTNEEWGREAIDEMLREGYDATLADTAIRKYLAAENLSNEENAIVQAALRAMGSPPVPLPPPVTDGQDGGDDGEYPGEPWPAPTGVKARRISKGQVEITFNETSPKAPGYRIYHNRAPYNVAHTLDNFVIVGGLRPGTKYKFHVRSLNKVGGYGPKSEQVSVRA